MFVLLRRSSDASIPSRSYSLDHDSHHSSVTGSDFTSASATAEGGTYTIAAERSDSTATGGIQTSSDRSCTIRTESIATVPKNATVRNSAQEDRRISNSGLPRW